MEPISNPFNIGSLSFTWQNVSRGDQPSNTWSQLVFSNCRILSSHKPQELPVGSLVHKIGIVQEMRVTTTVEIFKPDGDIIQPLEMKIEEKRKPF